MTVEKLNIIRGSIMPAAPQSSALYFIPTEEAGEMDIHMVGKSGTVRKTIGRPEVVNLINTALGGQNSALAVADIAARDALAATLTKSRFVMVADASADTEVTSGGAMYFFDPAKAGAQQWEKIYEAEGMDVVLQWNNIQGGPTSAPADIDDGVSKKHAHARLPVLEGINETAEGNLTYNGRVMGELFIESEW